LAVALRRQRNSRRGALQDWAPVYVGGRVFLPLQLGEELSKRSEILLVLAHDAEVGIAVDPIPCAFKLRLRVI
jgi:hypothetical protein